MKNGLAMEIQMKKIWVIIIIEALIIGIFAINTQACSVCRCGDNAFLFSEKGYALPGQSPDRHFLFSLANIYSTKSNALAPDEGSGIERQRETRPSLRLTYNLSERLSFSFETPIQFRRIETSMPSGTNRENSFGLGDADLSAIWMTNLAGGDGTFINGGLSFDLKVPTGRNNLSRDSERLDEHLQAGTGSIDWQAGVAVAKSTCSNQIFSSIYYRHNGENKFDYHYGNAIIFNLGSQWPFTTWFSGSIQANNRYAKRDIENRTIVENTGGWVSYLTPGLRFNLNESAGLYAALQIPVIQKLYGSQTEKAVFASGVSVGF